jgi:hypothetical protein
MLPGGKFGRTLKTHIREYRCLNLERKRTVKKGMARSLVVSFATSRGANDTLLNQICSSKKFIMGKGAP